MPDSNLHPISDRLIRRAEKERLLARKGGLLALRTLRIRKKHLSHRVGKMPFGPQYPFNRFGRRQPSLHPEQGSWVFGRRQGRKPQEGKRSRKIAGRKRIARHRIVHHSTRKIPQTSQKSHWRYGLFRNLRQGILRSMSAKRRKGLYAKAGEGKITSFTGKDSTFEEPNSPWLTIDTERASLKESTETLLQSVLKQIEF